MAEFMQRTLPPTAGLPQNLEVDDEIEKAAESFPDEHMTTTSSKDKKSREANGRGFQGYDEEAYYLPNDQTEAARLDLQHYIWKLMMNGHISIVPITPNIKNVLDVGTGTGIWCLELAAEHPEIQVTGTDLSAIQPDSKPPNCHFLQANAEEDWDFSTKFDFIHSRMLTMGMHDWPRFFKQCWHNLSPGGWLQTSETQFPQKRADALAHLTTPSPLLDWGQHCYTAAAQVGINARASEDFDSLLAAQGFVNVRKWEVQWPMSPWAKGRKNKLLGRLVGENMRKGIPGLSAGLLTKVLGWSVEEVGEFDGKVCEEMGRGEYYLPMVCHVAQKPLET